jgi:hypothetical protein
MAVGGSVQALWQPIRSGNQTEATSATSPNAIPGLAGWWDAGTVGGLLSSGGEPLSTWSLPTSGIANWTGGASITPYSFSGSTRLPLAVPRLSGLLGGTGYLTSATSMLAPALDPDLGFQLQSGAPGSSIGWTWYFVWSRPNWRQSSGSDSNPIAILSAGGRTILQADGPGGSGRLILFPGTNQTILSTALTRRHTHSVVLRFEPADGLNIWLDSNCVASGIQNQIPPSTENALLFLHDGTANGAAQCWFHEAASWTRALSDTEMSTLLTYANRWFRGPRRGMFLLFNGQSNSINYTLNDGAAAVLAQGIAWYLGALACNVLATTGSSAAYTMQSGHGLYAVTNGGYPGSFLNNPADGTSPSLWQLGADGLANQQVIASLSDDDRADIQAIIWPWNETDSLRNYSEGNIFQAAVQRFLSLERNAIGKLPQQLPLIWWNAIPYGISGGMQMHRQVVANLATDPAQNVIIGNPQTADSNARSSTWDPNTGIATGGDSSHRDSLDNQRFARLAAPIVARAILAAGNVDSVSTIPADLPGSGGPKITHAYRASNTSIILTVQHDCGNDLQVPLQAAAGAGFTVMDGGAPDSPGVLIAATACTRVDATHLRLTLAQPLSHPSPQCALYYPYGSATIGRGNAVTDNYSTIAKPPSWDIANDLGTAWSVDYPLAATFAPISLSDTAA